MKIRLLGITMMFIMLVMMNVANAQVSVTATAGDLGPTAYTTVKGAFDAINAGTHQGDISISLSGNTTETASAILNNSGAGSASYTSVSMTATVSVVISGAIAGAIIKLNGADNVTIDGRIAGAGRNITVQNTSTSASAAIWMASVAAGNGVTNSTIRNLEILCGISQEGSSTTLSVGIIMCGTTLSVTSNGTDNDNNSILDNRVIKCRYGIVTRGTTTNLNINPIVTGNIVGPSSFGPDQIGKTGILMQADQGALVSNNLVQFVGCLEPQACTGTDRNGIAIGDESWGTSPGTLTSNTYTVTNNIIHDIVEETTFSCVGLRIGTTGGGSPTNNVFANNFIYNVRANGTSGDQVAGIGISGGHTDKVVFNSVAMTGDVDPGAASACTNYGSGIRIGASAATFANLLLENNSVYMDLSSSSTAAVRFYAISGTSATFAFGTGAENYNDYYINNANTQLQTGGLGTTSGNALTNQFALLANWQAAYSPNQDANSIQANPSYISNTADLHVSPGTPNTSAGTPITGVADDIDGQPRSTPPFIGADELSLADCTDADGGTASVAGPSSFYTSGSATINNTGYSTGSGSTYEWEKSNDNFVSDIVNTGGTNPATFSTGAITMTMYYRLRVECSTNSSIDYSNIVTVTINTPPTAALDPSGNVSLCPPIESQILTASTNAASPSYVWKRNGVTIPSETNPTYSATTNGAYTVVITDGVTNCSNTSAATNISFPIAPASAIITPQDPELCEGSPALLLTASGSGGGPNGIIVSTPNINIPVPDNSAVGISHTLDVAIVPPGAIIDSVIITVNITTTFDGDVETTLEAPNGQIINLFADQGSTGDNFTNTRITSNTSFPLLPTSATGAPFTATWRATATLANLIGVPAPTTTTFSSLFSIPNGPWKLRVYDDANNDFATLVNWSIKIAYTEPPISYVWTPNGLGNGLYTDPPATMLYTGSPSTTVYAKPAITTLYTVTSSNAAGCTATASVNVVVNELTELVCPEDFELCINAVLLDLTTLSYSPVGGTFSGAGVSSNSFDASTAGPGPHLITYTYTDENMCTNTCTFTITVNALPVLVCPEDFDICVDAPIVDLTTLTYSPTGGTFSGPGVSGNNFNPFVATPGVHEIEYSYTDVNMCTNTCTFNITVNALPVLTCPDPFTVCELDDPFTLTGALPAGGDYSGEGVNMNQFNPGDAGPGMHSITYTYTDGNGCVNECEFIITVSPAYICASFMNWVLLPEGTENGACVSETDCCEDILCYGLEYTPGTTGDLLDYTTGFLVNCIGGNSPIISNESCVLDDNSFEINGCMSNNEVLFNSSAFQETFPALPVMQGVPVILHKVCFSVPVGQSLTITEDPITNLTTSIDVGLPNNVVEFPQFTSFTITRTGPVDPMDGQDNIQCVEGASEPDIPIVVNQCGEPIDPDLISITDTPSTLTCEGTRVYYYQFLDECSGFMVDWTFTYTIDRTIGPTEVGGPAATSANVNGIENAVPPALPVVQDYCGHILSPMLVSITDDPDPIVCFGTRVYVYKWVDCSGLQFDWSFTYNINNVPVVTCPEGFEVCMNVTPFNLTGGAPAGGVYSGAGVSMGVFSPAIAGVGTHIITYTYTNAQDCPNSCTFEIEVLPLPSVSCRPSAGVCVNEPPFVITGSSPAGGVYSGAGVTGNMFNPAAAGLGPHIITYTVTGANGCTNSCSFTFTVTNCPGDPEIEIIPIDPCEEEGPYGFCNFESDCCENILCYYIRYTPGYSGELTSYTTGFTTDCFGGLSPIIYNYSCVMTDNSEEALACNGDSILFNSSGNEGTLLITQGVPVILHRICFQIPPGETAEIFEDELTNLSTSIDLISGGTVFEFPSFTPVEITRELPEVPMDGSMTVDCPIEAVPPMLPTVYDQCCNEVEPELMSIVDTPTELICAGTRVYTYAYEDCGGGVSLWHFTYTIDSGPFPDPMNGSMTVDCPDDTDIPPALPTVEDNCGNVLLPVGPPELSLKPECQGQRTYTYTYMDCDGNAQDWVFTYNVIYLPFANPIDVTVTVECPSQTNTPPSTLPTVVDNCGNELLPIGPPDVSPLPPCDGQRTYTYTYMDCAGNTQDWQYIYDIEYETFEDPMDAGAMVDCPADTEFEPALPIVFDNCGNLLAPVGPPLISPMPPCEGDRTYTYLYMDCAGNTQNWVYTYTIEYEPFSVPADEEITVDCPNDTDLPPIPPIVMDNCNNILPTPMPLISPKPPCEGDRTYSYTYMDCEGNTDTWVYTYHIEYEDFSITSPPPSTVQCPQQAYIPPILPTITDNCNVILEPVTEAVDGEVVCEGTRTYTYIYQDCEGNQDEYVFTYIVDVPPPAVPANDGITVDCPDDTTVEPTPPQVPDVCFGGFIIPMGPIVSPPLVCEGNRTYTWTYTNCAGESVNWVYTYTVEFEPFANPVDGNLIVDCPDDTDVAPELPVVMDNCNNVLNPSVPLISDKPECEGERTYTYTYMDCAGNTQDWEFTYIVEYEPFTVPVSPTSFVSCPDEDDEAPVPPVVSDNCGEILLTPTPVISADVTCQGTRTYTYNYTDCADNTAAWIYTYVVDVPVPVVPMNEGSIVDCPDDTDMMPTPPQVPDVCFGGFIIPSGPAISTKPMCEGTRTYTWTYANCAGESVDWVYTYTVIYLPFADPDDDGIQVACPDDTDEEPPLPVVVDNCNNVLTPVLFSISEKPTCEGVREYTYIYTDCDGNSHDWVFTYDVEYEEFIVPSSPTDFVTCPDEDDVAPTPPVVYDACGELLATPVPEISPDITCQGTRTYTYVYEDCTTGEAPWVYTYVVDVPLPVVPMNEGSTVECPDDTDEMPTPPQVPDVCFGGFITPSGPAISPKPTCEGLRTYTWTYANCAGESVDWVYTYNVDRTILPVQVGPPVETTSTVECYLEATAPLTLPTIEDGCGNILPAPMPVVGGTNNGTCTGTVTYTYNYVDCAGQTYVWVYTYLVDCVPIQVKVFLEGPYNISTNLMSTSHNSVLHTLPGQFPTVILYDTTDAGHPYTIAPWNYTATLGTQFGDDMGQTPYPPTVVDWVLVQIRQNGISPANTIWQCAGWVHENGDVTFPENCPLPAFALSDSFKIVVQHRNHLGVMSPVQAAEPCGTAVLSWDFRTSNSYIELFSFGQKQVEPGVWAMHAGNGKQAPSGIGIINSVDFDTWKADQGTFGYKPGDYNLNSSTNSVDETVWKNNQGKSSAVIFY